MDGQPVAIKVQRPGAEETIALDLYILRSYAPHLSPHLSPPTPPSHLTHPPSFLPSAHRYSMTLTRITKLLGRDIDLVSVIDDFGHLLYSEIDYSLEADNARRFTSLYGSLPNVSAPQIYPDLSSRRVLTMEWIDGVRLTDREGLQSYGLDPSALVDTLVQCSLRQMLANGFFHADPHAGNLLVKENGELVYIDFGMMSYLADTQVRTHTLLSGTHTIPHPLFPHTLSPLVASVPAALRHHRGRDTHGRPRLRRLSKALSRVRLHTCRRGHHACSTSPQ